MQVTLLKAKLHRACVTEADIDYEGSIAIDNSLLEESGMLPYEKVLVVDVENGQRFETYIIPSDRQGMIQVNGAAARLVAVGDHVIVMAFAQFEYPPEPGYLPKVVVLDGDNRPLSGKSEFRE